MRKEAASNRNPETMVEMEAATNENVFNGHDEEQVRLMEEVCIEVDNNDRALRPISKKDAHLRTSIESGTLHRAFSVFLFDSRGRLLLQQRANEKITFPQQWTNTCCSHPLHVASEMVEDEVCTGVKRAAVRKLSHELGITSEHITVEDLNFICRIQYAASSDGVWGESEIDYILFAQKDVDLHVNPNEVQNTKYVNQSELKELLKKADDGEVQLTPWFKLICKTFLFDWWSELPNVVSHRSLTTIYRL